MWGSTFGVLSVARLARITLLLLLVLGCWQECSGYDKQGRVGTADRIVRQRLVQLKRIAKLRTRQYHCNHQKIIRITEIPFGNSGNNLIEFTHGLWVAKHLNGTLLVPHWIAHILKPFDTTLLRSMFCYVLLDQFDEKNPPANTAFVDITSEDSFFLFKIFSMPESFTWMKMRKKQTSLRRRPSGRCSCSVIIGSRHRLTSGLRWYVFVAYIATW
jgi:hypothetical protein